MTRPLSVEDIWNLVPNVDCKGLCAPACRVVGMSEEEFIKMEDRVPDFPMWEEMLEEQRVVGEGNYQCPNLTAEGRCGQYDVRPLTCRLYGVAEQMKCPHGCVPSGGFMPAAEASALFDLMAEIGGPVV